MLIKMLSKQTLSSDLLSVMGLVSLLLKYLSWFGQKNLNFLPANHGKTQKILSQALVVHTSSPGTEEAKQADV